MVLHIFRKYTCKYCPFIIKIENEEIFLSCEIYLERKKLYSAYLRMFYILIKKTHANELHYKYLYVCILYVCMYVCTMYVHNELLIQSLPFFPDMTITDKKNERIYLIPYLCIFFSFQGMSSGARIVSSHEFHTYCNFFCP